MSNQSMRQPDSLTHYDLQEFRYILVKHNKGMITLEKDCTSEVIKHYFYSEIVNGEFHIVHYRTSKMFKKHSKKRRKDFPTIIIPVEDEDFTNETAPEEVISVIYDTVKMIDDYIFRYEYSFSYNEL